MATTYRMNREQMLMFVKLYKLHECLWNPHSPLNKNREARNQAMRSISEEMRIAGFGTREVAQKIKNLRSTYFQEIKKIASSEKLGVTGDNVYKPKLSWFEEAHEMFSKHSQSESRAVGENSGDESDVTSEQNLTNENPFYHLQLDLVKEEVFDDFPVKIEDDLNSFGDSQSKNDGENFFRINEVIEKLENAVRAIQPASGPHEYDAFGQYVASALKSLPAENAIAAQTEIFNIIANEKKKVIFTQK